MAATRPAKRTRRRLIVAAALGAGALCAPAPAVAADPLAPIDIRVQGAIPEDAKNEARMTVRDEGRPQYRGRVGIELRGQSSRLFPKKALSIELRDRKGGNRDVGLLGMPADDD